MKVRELVSEFPSLLLTQGNPELEVSYIQSDSRKIQEGDIFILYEEFTQNGKTFILDSLERGAKVLLLPTGFEFSNNNSDLVILFTEAPTQIHGYLASFLLGKPSEKLKIIAVTGTNGKTSTTHILYSILNSLGIPTGLIGTISAKYKDFEAETGYTTPDPSGLNFLLHEMLKAGIEFVCMEASSHGLKLGRLNGIALYSGLFTNLTPDHLDFHLDMQDYLISKFKLFELLELSPLQEKLGLLNLDTAGGIDMYSLIKKFNPSYKIITLGETGNYSSKLEELNLKYTKFTISKDDNIYQLSTNLLGKFNYENLSLALICLLESLPELDSKLIFNKISNLPFVPGRFELHYPKEQNKVVIVDYAHTPDALENILSSMKEIPNSMLITLFGCGGDRDRKKRPLMAKITAKYSDFIIVTSDNPRTEDPNFILDEIIAGFPNDYKRFLRIENRRDAIRKGIEILPENGFLLIAGKGHENYQIIGRTKHHFSDAEEVKIAFNQNGV